MIFLIFFVFWPFRKKSKKNEKNQKNPGCPRRESQGLQPGLQPGATQDPGEEGFSRPETPDAGRPRLPDFFFHFFDFFRFVAFSKKIKNLLVFCLIFLLFREKIKKQKNEKKSRVPPQGGSRAPARAPGWTHSGKARNPPPARRPRVPDFFDCFIFFRSYKGLYLFSKRCFFTCETR